MVQRPDNLALSIWRTKEKDTISIIFPACLFITTSALHTLKFEFGSSIVKSSNEYIS